MKDYELSPTSFYYKMCRLYTIKNGVVRERATGKTLFCADSAEEACAWLKRCIYYKYYANDTTALKNFLLGQAYGTVVGLENPHVVDEIIEGCVHEASREDCWKVANGERVTIGDISYIPITNDIVKVYCPEHRCSIKCGEIIVYADAIRRYLAPGWIIIDGPHGKPRYAHRKITRYYHSLAPDDNLKQIISCLTHVLNSSGIRYRLKIANNSAGLARNDAIVLYASHALNHELLVSVSGGFGGAATSYATPPLTLRLCGGWATALEVSDSGSRRSLTSYGLTCCGAIANGIYRSGGLGVVETFQLVCDEFHYLGLNPLRPYQG